MNQKYKVIYADPPWSFETYSSNGKGRSAEAHYDCMSFEQIKSLAVADLTDNDCVLLMWVTDPFLFKSKEVIEAWGFTYKTVAFHWAKCRGDMYEELDDTRNWPIGTGYWTRANPEICLLATKGKPKPQAHGVHRLIVAPRREHSRKPDEAYERIEKLCHGPYVELFARIQQPGWDTAFSTLEGVAQPRRWKSTTPTPIPVNKHIDIFSI